MKRAEIEAVLAEHPNAVFRRAYNSWTAPEYFTVIGFEHGTPSYRARRGAKGPLMAKTVGYYIDNQGKVQTVRDNRLIPLMAVGVALHNTVAEWKKARTAERKAKAEHEEQQRIAEGNARAAADKLWLELDDADAKVTYGVDGCTVYLPTASANNLTERLRRMEACS